MTREYSVRLDWSVEDDAYVATSPEFPGLTGVAANADDALRELREALEMAIEVLEEDGDTLPLPRCAEEYSGQFRLRVSKSLHRRLVARAEEEGVSLNAYAFGALAHAVGHSEGQSRAWAEMRQLGQTGFVGSLRAAGHSALANSPTSEALTWKVPPQATTLLTS